MKEFGKGRSGFFGGQMSKKMGSKTKIWKEDYWRKLKVKNGIVLLPQMN